MESLGFKDETTVVVFGDHGYQVRTSDIGSDTTSISCQVCNCEWKDINVAACATSFDLLRNQLGEHDTWCKQVRKLTLLTGKKPNEVVVAC